MMTHLAKSYKAKTFVRPTQHQQDAYVPEKCDVSEIGFFRHLDSIRRMGVVDDDGWTKMIDEMRLIINGGVSSNILAYYEAEDRDRRQQRQGPPQTRNQKLN